MKYAKLILSCLLISTFLIGCGNNEQSKNSVQEFGNIDSSLLEDSSSKQSEESIDNTNLPYYDATNLVTAKTYSSDDKHEETSSYYREQLSTRPKKAFDAIYSSAKNMTGNIEFESSQFVTPSELKNIMNILFLDCPEIFYLNNSYSYEVNEEGYVTKVYLEFGMTAEEIQKIQTQLVNDKPFFIKVRRDNDYETIKSVIEKAKIREYASISIGQDGTYDLSVCEPFNSKSLYKNSIGASKLLCYWFRQLGIESTVVVGEIVSDTLTDDYELTTDYLKYCNEYMVSDGIYKVEFNYTYYWLWNAVKIDDNWYNLDYSYSFLVHKKYGEISEECLWFVPDRTISQTRLFYMNEEILGISPSCTDSNFEKSYREGYYILPHTETQMVLRIKQELAAIDQANSMSVSYQFEDEDTYNYFLDNFDEQVEYYNNTYGDAIGYYKINACRDSLSITISDIVNNY